MGAKLHACACVCHLVVMYVSCHMRLTVAWTWRDLNVEGYYVAIVRMFSRMWVNGSLTGVDQYCNDLDFSILLFWGN